MTKKKENIRDPGPVSIIAPSSVVMLTGNKVP